MKALLLTVLALMLTLALFTAVNPALGYATATLIGELIAQPILAALRLGLFIRGIL